MDTRTTILYVDDNPRSSRLLTGVLEECDFRVIAKNDPVEALALCRRTGFDLALLDYEMPTINGARLAREIKYLMPDLPIVLISARTELTPAELEFVDAHFGFGTSLDDLLWTMRILVKPKVVVAEHRHLSDSMHRLDSTSAHEPHSRWSDST